MTDASPSHSLRRILSRQREWSLRAFGPGRRTQSTLSMIEHACAGVDQGNHELIDCIDVMVYALELCWRSGADLDQIELALHEKMAGNEAHRWSPLGWIGDNAEINHVRDEEVTDA